jgi:hypothetical protein
VIVLLLVCIATATLFVWLLVEFGRLILRADRGDMAADRLVHGVAGGVRGAAGRFGGATGSGGHRVKMPRATVGTYGDGAAVTGGEAEADQSWVRHDMEVEESVRERLYGVPRRGGRADGGGARGGAAGADRGPTPE